MSHQISPIIDTETMRSDSKKTLETEIEMHSMSNSPQRESRAVHDSHLATLTSTPRLGLSCLCVHQNWIIAGSDHVSGLLFAWDFDAESTTTPVTIEGHSGPVTGLLDLGSSFVSSSKDGTIQEWKDFSLRQIVNEDSLSMLRKKGHPLCMAHQWDNNGSSGSLFSGGTDTKIYEWDVEEGTSVEGYFQGHSGWVNVLALSLDGSTLASGSTDRTIRLWNIETRECIAELTGHLDWITALAFDSQEYLISGCRDGIIRKWSLNDKESKELYHGEPVRSIQLLTHPDSHSSSLIFMGDDKTIYAQDMSSLEIKTRLNGHFGGIRASVLTKGRLLTASRDGTVRKWRLKGTPNIEMVSLFTPLII